MNEDLIEPARIRAIQELIRGFLMDEVINLKGEFHSDQRISVARANPKKPGDGDDHDDKYYIFKNLLEKTYEHSYLQIFL